MNVLSTNLILALVWAALSGEFSLQSLASGYALGFVALWMVQPLTGTSRYFFRVFAWIRLIVMFLYELAVSSLQVAWDVLTPQHLSRPGLVEVPLDVKSDAGILLVTNLISLTPGTLSIDISADRSTLTVHAMFVDDSEALCRELKAGMEKWVIDAVEGS